MKKMELVELIAKKSELTKVQAHKALNAFLESIEETLKKHEEINLIGFGTFKVSKRSARVGKNLRTGEVINIPAYNVPAFKSGKSLKQAVN